MKGNKFSYSMFFFRFQTLWLFFRCCYFYNCFCWCCISQSICVLCVCMNSVCSLTFVLTRWLFTVSLSFSPFLFLRSAHSNSFEHDIHYRAKLLFFLFRIFFMNRHWARDERIHFTYYRLLKTNYLINANTMYPWSYLKTHITIFFWNTFTEQSKWKTKIECIC